MMLFDQIILSKKNRGRTSFFGKSSTDFLSDTTDHLYVSAATTPPNSKFPGDYRSIVTRSKLLVIYICKSQYTDFYAAPASLDPALMKEPRVIQGVPRLKTAQARRKPIPSMLGPNGIIRVNGNGLSVSPPT